MNIISARWLVLLAVGFVGSLLADTVAPIGWRETGGITVEANSEKTVNAPLAVADHGTFVKAGKGTLNLSTKAFDTQGTKAKYVALEGVVKLTEDDVVAEEPVAPSVLMERAALWVSAAKDESIVESGEKVTTWHDVRETSNANPSRYYMASACVAGKTDQGEVKKDYQGNKAVWFGGIDAKGKGGYMRLKDATGADASMQYVFNVFFVHGIETTLGTVIGHVGNPSDFMMNGPDISPIGRVGYYYYHGETTPGAVTARHFRNGVQFDPFHETVAKTFELVEADFVDRPTAFSTFFNNRNSENRQGGDYLSEVVVFTNRLSEAERMSVQRYLLDKWNLKGSGGSKPRLGVGQSASIELDVSEDMLATNGFRVAFDGEGTVKKTGTGRMSVTAGMFKDFNGGFELLGGSLFSRFDELPVLVPQNGKRYNAFVNRNTATPSDVNNGLYLTQDVGEPDKIIKDGLEDLAFDSVPEATKRLVVERGTLSLRGRKNLPKYAEGAAINVAFPNANAESEQFEVTAGKKRRYSVASGTTKAGWTFVGTGTGFAGGFLVGPLLQSDGRDWLFEIQEGNQALYLFSNDGKSEGSGAIYTTGTFPAPGEYLVSWRESRYKSNYLGAYDLMLGKTWAEATVVERRVVADGCYPRVYAKVVIPEAGEYCLGFRISNGAGYFALSFDDLKADFIATSDRAKVVKIPNGDFEQITADGSTLSWVKSDKLTYQNSPLGWTIHHGDGWSTTVGFPVVAIVSPTLPLQRSQSKDSTGAVQDNAIDIRYSRFADESLGTFQLLLLGSAKYGANHYAKRTFTVAEPGVYRLRGKVSQWNFNQSDWSENFTKEGSVNASVTIGGETTDLGDLAAVSHVQADRVWKGAFAVTAANTEITITLHETVDLAGCLVDDLVLVNDDTPALSESCELISNGSFEDYAKAADNGSVVNEAIWTLVANPNDENQKPSFWRGFSTGLAHTVVPYDGEVVCSLRGAASITQEIPWVEKGRYRFRLAANTRWTKDWDENGVRVTLNDSLGNVKYELLNVSEVTNYEAKVFEQFTNVDVAGAYTLVVSGTHAEYKSGTSLRCCSIDGLSLMRDYGERLPPDVSPELHITVNEGAKLNLDFTGTVKTAPVRLGGRGVTGVVNASTYPDYITGDGTIEAENRSGLMLIFR